MKNSTSQISDTDLHDILEIARLAPSVHNSQGWLAKPLNGGVSLHIDERYKLRNGDPTGRQAVMGIGIFAEAIILVAKDKGFRANTIDFRNDVATIYFEKGNSARQTSKTSEALLKTRSTDRSIYKSANLSKPQIKLLKETAEGLATTVHVVTDVSHIKTVAALTSHGIALAMSSPDFRKELSEYLIVPWSKKTRGISVKSLYIPSVIAYIEPILMKFGVGLPLEVKLERKRWESASAIISITAGGDLSKYWFNAGRTYMRLSLAIEDLGLSQATSGAIVEASNYHDDVEAILETNERILSMLRIGAGSKKRQYSRRAPLQDIIASN